MLACFCPQLNNTLFAQTEPEMVGPASPGETVEVHHKRFSGKHHSHRKQAEVEDKSNFNLKQAQDIIAENEENKEKNQKKASKSRKNYMTWLYFLNSGSRSQNTKSKKKIQYDFY